MSLDTAHNVSDGDRAFKRWAPRRSGADVTNGCSLFDKNLDCFGGPYSILDAT
jgi:hypothetical protein